MVTPASSQDKIIMSFGWKGPISSAGGWSQGGVQYTEINLEFEGYVATEELSVSLNDKISSVITQKLPFTFTKCGEEVVNIRDHQVRFGDRVTYPYLYKLSIEKLNSLILKAAWLERSPRIVDIMDSRTGIVTSQDRAIRREREIDLSLPKELEAGSTYCLEITSDNGLSARLVKEPKKDDEKMKP